MHVGRVLFGLLYVYFLVGATLRSSAGIDILQKPVERTTITISSASLPRHLVFPALSINIPVKAGGIKNNTWVLSEDSAHVMEAAQKNSYVIYAHQYAGLFLDLKSASINSRILVTNEKGLTESYTVYAKEHISPAELDKIHPTHENELVLFTCDGWFDNTRVVVRAKG